jgi:diguanylate cyclase (GGDEF)-like protein
VRPRLHVCPGGLTAPRVGPPDAHPGLARLERRLARERRARLKAEEIAERATMNALHDPLTGLANRNLFVDRLRNALERSRRTGQPLAVFFLDLDRFKLLNDSLGHAAGDLLLAEVAVRLRRSVRPYDTVARMGGDEFTVLCEGMLEPGSLARRVAAALQIPMRIGDAAVRTSASVGVVIADSSHTDADDVLRDADAAMYAAKQRGKARVELFDPGMRRRVAGRLELEAEVRRAIETNQIEPFYQPIVDAGTCQVVGFEALARWRHPERGTVAPADFIPACEEVGLAGELGRLMLRAASFDLRRFQELCEAEGGPWVSVNLSGAQLSRPELLGTVREAIRDSGVDPGSLILEITEHALMSDTSDSVASLLALARLGVRLALDDFGTGYSSLTRLRQLPIHLLKVDRSFTAGLGSNPADGAIVGAVVGLAQALGLHTVGEGVETAAQLDVLRRLGCDQAQGYLLGLPLCAAETERSLRRPAAA